MTLAGVLASLLLSSPQCSFESWVSYLLALRFVSSHVICMGEVERSGVAGMEAGMMSVGWIM